MTAPEQDTALERNTLHFINMIAYGSSSRVHSRRLRDVTGIDLPPSDIRLVECLAGREPLPLSAVASELGIDLAQASRQATALEALGHVVRATDPADRRRTLVCLSPATAALMDRWLLDWSSGYADALGDWSPDDLAQLTRWFDHVLVRLQEALPGRTSSTLPARWQHLVREDKHSVAQQRFLGSLVALVSWAGQSGGFNDILEELDAPIRQHAYFTLRMVSRHGPISIAEVAERMAIDPSQASKRLRQLTELGLVDRAVDTFDRRSSRVRASRKGAALERKVRDWQLRTTVALLGPITAKNRRSWGSLMEQFMQRLDEAAERSDRWAGLTTGAVSR
ncbi:MAG: MarR family transcriptional regulator [Mycobacteriales bacterium]